MSDRGSMAWHVALSLALIVPGTFAPSRATAQSGDERVQLAAKTGVYRDLSANESRMAATRQDKAQVSDAIVRSNALLSRASPAVSVWVREEAHREARREPSVSVAAEAARARFGNELASGDIDALVELVMMEISREAGQELRDELAQMQEINQEKKTQREAAQKMRDSQSAMHASMRADASAVQPRTSRAELAAYVAAHSDGEDSLDDMSEEQQLRMQAAMDRRQKAFEALSNMMKKASETESTIIGNLK